ncbi:MAG: VWA domain-containing protein [Phycisphaerales bacterium]|nr:VWA domain-containing protein [Phycisphaerales bacterium]
MSRVTQWAPWILSIAMHALLALVLLTTGVFVMGHLQTEPDASLRPEAIFSFEGVPMDRPRETTNGASDDASTTNMSRATEAPAVPAAAEVSEAMDRRTRVNQASVLNSVERPTSRLESPRTLVSVAGVRQSAARRIVYVLDASGSMIGGYPSAVREVIQSISRLTEEQQFAVVVFQAKRVIVPPISELRRAGPTLGSRAIEALSTWLLDEVSPAGESDPREALQSALALQPDTIIIVSAGIMGVAEVAADRDALLAFLDRLNPRDARIGRRPVQIACIHLIEEEPLGALEAIAREHGGPGAYRFIDRLANFRGWEDASIDPRQDETTLRLGHALSLLKAGDLPTARTQLLRIGLGEPLHSASAIALVSAAEMSLLSDRDPWTATRLASAALQSARAFGLDTTVARAESVLRAAESPRSEPRSNPTPHSPTLPTP